MGAFTVIRTPAFDLLAGDCAREHSKLEADLSWLTGRLAEAPEQMGDHVPELGGLALPIFKTRCKDSCHRIGASGAWRIYYALNKPAKKKHSCCFSTTKRNTRIREPGSSSRKWNAPSHRRRNPGQNTAHQQSVDKDQDERSCGCANAVC